MKKLSSVDLLRQESILSDLSKRGPPTPLIRGEKNYFPEGVLRSYRLNTLSTSRNTQLTPLNLPVSSEHSFSSDFTQKTEISLEFKSRKLSPLEIRNEKPNRAESLKSRRRRRRLTRQEKWLSTTDAAIIPPNVRIRDEEPQDCQERADAAENSSEVILPRYQDDIGYKI